MATISTRVDDGVKEQAERIADSIGIPLSTAINIFIKKFISENGFPFSVTASAPAERKAIIDTAKLDEAVKKAVSDSNNSGLSRNFSYLDPNTQTIITINREE